MCLVHCNTEWTRVVRDVSCAFIVTLNGHVLLEMCLVHCDTEWTRVVKDVSLCTVTQNGHVYVRDVSCALEHKIDTHC